MIGKGNWILPLEFSTIEIANADRFIVQLSPEPMPALGSERSGTEYFGSLLDAHNFIGISKDELSVVFGQRAKSCPSSQPSANWSESVLCNLSPDINNQNQIDNVEFALNSVGKVFGWRHCRMFRNQRVGPWITENVVLQDTRHGLSSATLLPK